MQKSPGVSVYGGLSGLQLHIPKYLFPPPFENASRLTYYSTFFNSIEINSSFYKMPNPLTIRRWVEMVHEKFRFTFKLSKAITHASHLDFKEEDVVEFYKAINAAQDKKGCLLLQFPPRLDITNFARLKKLLACIRKIDAAQNWKMAVEFRNKSWYQQRVYDLLNQYNSTLVIHDIPKSATPLLNFNSDFVYIRFHGPTGNYRDSYAEYFLEEYVTYIHECILTIQWSMLSAI